MTSSDLLLDAFGRVHGLVPTVVEGLSVEQLRFRPDEHANSIAWLIWHLTRIEDDHVAGVADVEQVWTSQGWMGRFALPFAAGASGYGHSSEDVAAVSPPPELLAAYYEAVHEQTVAYVQGLTDADLARVVDRAWDPPVTLGVRLMSVISDGLQHVGQASYLRGLVLRR
ncbi:MAG TPA: DUF664 domain-containing protein [Pedococcus sp.]|nr:DUF664 domain-containing protein [Pedococcus sp.]